MKEQILKLNEICEIITSPVDKKRNKDEKAVLLCNYTDVYYNNFITNKIKFMEATAKDNEIQKYSLYKGDIVITKDSETPDDIGISTYIAENIKNLVCGYHLAILRPNPKYVCGLYLAYYLKLQNILYIFGKYANGITRYSLINTTYKSIPILLPPLAEQRKIAEILSLWDKAIQQTKELITYKEKYKKGLMQNLLTGKTRLNCYTCEWKTYKLKNILKEINIRNKNNKETNILSVTNKQGFVMQNDFFDRRVASKDTTNYKVIYKNQFAYNPSRINVGSFALLQNYDIGILSPMYIVFECNNLLYYKYCNYWLTSYLFTGVIKKYLSGSVRDSLNFRDMGQIPIFLPPLDEQKAIADILSSADKEIDLLKKQLDLYTEQKKGLMQNLLTGKVRV